MTGTATGSRAAPHLAAAEWALVGVSIAVVYGFGRLFGDWSFFWPLVLVGAYAHLSSSLLRRRGWGVAVSALLSTAGFVVLATWLWFGRTTTAMLPTGRTWDAVRTSMDESWGAFQELSAPVPSMTGFVAAAGVALFFAVFLADWAAFRLWSPVEAVIPGLTLFVFCAVLGSDRQRIASAVAFAGAVLVFMLVQRVARLELTSGWLSADVERGSRWLLRTGAALSVLAVFGGIVVGPRLPGADDAALIGWREDEGPSSRVVISPLVEIRNRMVNQSDLEAFTVESTEPSYWRLTALDIFDGTIWRSGGRYAEADGELPVTPPGGDVSQARVEQTFEIGRLAAPWLPAAFQPVSIDSADVGVRYQSESSTLIVDGDQATSDDLRYTVVSQLPRPSTQQLDTPRADLLVGMQGFVELPADFSDRARNLARRSVDRSGAVTPYDQAIALQDFFLDRGVFADDEYEFVYDLQSVPAGHSGSAIDDFLENQRGYCEQYAGTYAAMARSIGLPARVAVGFTMGEQEDPQRPGVYTVRGRNAHAWPEVWLGGEVGWVAFEPTPGRGAPGMDYAGVTPAQASADDAAGASATTSTSAPTTTAPATPDAGDEPTPEELAAMLGQTGGPQSPADDEAGTWWEDLLASGLVRVGLPLVVVLGVLYLVLVPLLLGARRRRRRQRAGGADGRVRVAWEETLDELALIGAERLPHETHDEFAGRAAEALPAHGPELRRLAVDTDAATFASDLVDDETAARAEATMAAVEGTVRARVPRGRMLLHRLDARPLVRQWRGTPRKAARTSRR